MYRIFTQRFHLWCPHHVIILGRLRALGSDGIVKHASPATGNIVPYLVETRIGIRRREKHRKHVKTNII